MVSEWLRKHVDGEEEETYLQCPSMICYNKPRGDSIASDSANFRGGIISGELIVIAVLAGTFHRVIKKIRSEIDGSLITKDWSCF